MKLSWYGTAALILESGGYRLAVDPFLGSMPEETRFRRRIFAYRLRNVDAVLVTHGHFDHICQIPKLYRHTETPIYATVTPCKTLLKRGMGKERLHKLAPGDCFTLGDFTVRVYRGRHCKFDFGVLLQTVFKSDTFLHPKRLIELLKLNRRYPENGETLFYEIEAEGKRIHLMGSMGLDAGTAYPTDADALVQPFQGTARPADTVTPIIGRLQPKAVYLDHYDDAFPPMSSRVKTVDFVARLKAHGIPAFAMKPGRVYEI